MKAHSLISLSASVASILGATPLCGAFPQSHQGVFPRDATPGVAPELSTLKPEFFPELKSQRVKIRYGPYTMPDVRENNLEKMLMGEGGMIDTMSAKAKKPCDDCTITFIHAGLEYPNGTDANIDTGSWLHHMVMSTTGPGRKDAVCGIPGMERMFSSGNERSISNFCWDGKLKAGYKLRKTDTLSLMAELMNENPFPVPVYVTITYEFIPALQPDFRDVKVLWFDVSNCGPSFVMPKNTETFNYTMRTWTANFDGDEISVGGHMHDGGEAVKIYQNDKVICDSVATYGQNPAFVQKNEGMEHISHMLECQGTGPIKKGDKFRIEAFYDTSKHKLMESNGKSFDPVMGIALLSAAVNN